MARYQSAFESAKSRCNNPNNKNYPNYGGRGIKFLFTSYLEFETELGLRPDGYTLDRINNDGNYKLGNIKWSSKVEQNNNRRKHKQHSVHKDSSTGYLGITFDKTRQCYLVRDKTKYLGRKKTLKDAIQLKELYGSQT